MQSVHIQPPSRYLPRRFRRCCPGCVFSSGPLEQAKLPTCAMLPKLCFSDKLFWSSAVSPHLFSIFRFRFMHFFNSWLLFPLGVVNSKSVWEIGRGNLHPPNKKLQEHLYIITPSNNSSVCEGRGVAISEMLGGTVAKGHCWIQSEITRFGKVAPSETQRSVVRRGAIEPTSVGGYSSVAFLKIFPCIFNYRPLKNITSHRCVGVFFARFCLFFNAE